MTYNKTDLGTFNVVRGVAQYNLSSPYLISKRSMLVLDLNGAQIAMNSTWNISYSDIEINMQGDLVSLNGQTFCLKALVTRSRFSGYQTFYFNVTNFFGNLTIQFVAFNNSAQFYFTKFIYIYIRKRLLEFNKQNLLFFIFKSAHLK